jgi:hypothetical protein
MEETMTPTLWLWLVERTTKTSGQKRPRVYRYAVIATTEKEAIRAVYGEYNTNLLADEVVVKDWTARVNETNAIQLR